MPSVLTEQDVLKIIDEADDFSTLSTAAVQISQMTQDLQVPVGKVAKLISMDVALSTKLLRVVNSSLLWAVQPGFGCHPSDQYPWI